MLTIYDNIFIIKFSDCYWRNKFIFADGIYKILNLLFAPNKRTLIFWKYYAS